MERNDNLLPENMVKDYEETASLARKSGQTIDINTSIGWVSIEMPNTGESYFFQDNEAFDLLDTVPDNITPEDFILAIAQGW